MFLLYDLVLKSSLFFTWFNNPKKSDVPWREVIDSGFVFLKQITQNGYSYFYNEKNIKESCALRKQT